MAAILLLNATCTSHSLFAELAHSQTAPTELHRKPDSEVDT